MSRCRYCYQTGHNRRTCPVLTERMADRANNMIAQGYPDHWMVKEYQDRIAPKGKKVSQQTCGYCQKRGHTRRKCEKIQKDKEWFAKHHNDHVRLALDYIVSSPVGIGSLFRQQRKEYNYQTNDYVTTTNTFILTDFEMPKRIHRNNMVIMALLTNPKNGDVLKINVRDYVINPNYGRRWSSSVSLVSPETQAVPSDWAARETISIDSLKSHEHFLRVGRKQEDLREWEYTRIEEAQEKIHKFANGDSNILDRTRMIAEKELAYYTIANNRAKIFEDFKSGE